MLSLLRSSAPPLLRFVASRLVISWRTSGRAQLRWCTARSRVGVGRFSDRRRRPPTSPPVRPCHARMIRPAPVCGYRCSEAYRDAHACSFFRRGRPKRGSEHHGRRAQVQQAPRSQPTRIVERGLSSQRGLNEWFRHLGPPHPRSALDGSNLSSPLPSSSLLPSSSRLLFSRLRSSHPR